MASKLAIALVRQNALARLENAMIALGNEFGIEQPNIQKVGRDEDLLQANQLDAIATWLEQIAAAVSLPEVERK